MLVLQRLHQGPGTVGLLYTTMGITAFVTVFIAGRIDSDGRERMMMLLALLGTALALALLPFATSIWQVFGSLALLGVAVAPFDLALFTLRQRRTHAAWIGRAFRCRWRSTSLDSPSARPWRAR